MWRTKQLLLSVLLKDTSAVAGIRTHILATPELESNALDRSATTLHGPHNEETRNSPLFSPLEHKLTREEWGDVMKVSIFLI